MSAHADLSIQEVAELLNVSDSYVVGLLDNGELSSQEVDGHRRVLRVDAESYRATSLLKRKAALDALAREAQNFGLGY